MPTAAQTREAINSALIQIETRLSAGPSQPETDALQTAYTALWLQLAKADDEQLGAVAERVIIASRRLEQIIRSSSTLPQAAYQAALSATANALADGMGQHDADLQPGGHTEQPPDAEATLREKPEPSASQLTEGSAWSDLVSTYRAYSGVSAALKTVSLAQWIVESGRGGSELARRHLNFGGIKFRDRMAGHASPVDYTGSDGESTVYCKFSSATEFIAGYWHFIASGPYEGWDRFQEDGAGYLRHIAPRYAGDTSYITKVLAVFEEARALLGLAGVTNGVAPEPTGNLTPVAVVIGHNQSSTGHPGRSPIDAAEYDWNTVVADVMVQEAGHYGLQVAVVRRQAGLGYREEISRAYEDVATLRPRCVIELHYNGVDDPSANGIEMLCRPDRAGARALAQSLVNEVQGLLHLKKRRSDGVFLLNLGDRGAASCFALDDVPTVLCEPFFVTNANDRAAIAAVGQAALARAYLRAIRSWISMA